MDVTQECFCRKCGKSKDISCDFYVDKRYNRPRSICKDCVLAGQTQYRKKNRTNINDNKRVAYAKDKTFYTSMLRSTERNDIFSWRSLRHVGRRYGNWMVLELVGYLPVKSHHHSRRTVAAKVQCICGKVEVKRLNNVTCNGVFGCGCAKALPDREAVGFNMVRKSYIQSARKRHLFFQLSNDDLNSMFKAKCHYCGASPGNVQRTKTGSEYVYNGIDRKNPTLGYVPENCVPCCYKCNKAKMELQYDDFLQHVKEIVTWMSHRNQPLAN